MHSNYRLAVGASIARWAASLQNPPHCRAHRERDGQHAETRAKGEPARLPPNFGPAVRIEQRAVEQCGLETRERK